MVGRNSHFVLGNQILCGGGSGGIARPGLFLKIFLHLYCKVLAFIRYFNINMSWVPGVLGELTISLCGLPGLTVVLSPELPRALEAVALFWGYLQPLRGLAAISREFPPVLRKSATLRSSPAVLP